MIILCRELTPEIVRLQEAVSKLLEGSAELVFTLDGVDHYVPINDILFFESDSGRTAAHTKSAMYYSDHRLCELEKMLGYNFIRISKSCIVNTREVNAIRRNLSGASEVMFKGCRKHVYASRMYYKPLETRIQETRGIL